MRFQLYSLKDLMEDFYISEISSKLEVNPDDIEYQDSQTITVNEKSVETLLSVKQTSKKKVFHDAECRVLNYLRTFSCTLNEDVQNFLHHEDKGIRMQKESTSRTYLIVDSEKDTIAAYFAIAFKPIILEKQLMITDKKKGKLPVHSNEVDDVEVLPTILIGQIGRDDTYSKKNIDLKLILDFTFGVINLVREYIGGRVILIEVDNNPKLIELYEYCGFERIQENGKLSQLMQFVKHY